MKRANRPIISFIHSASKKVRNNKLCQVYLNANLMGITLAFSFITHCYIAYYKIYPYFCQ